jgi:hypothetical protein
MSETKTFTAMAEIQLEDAQRLLPEFEKLLPLELFAAINQKGYWPVSMRKTHLEDVVLTDEETGETYAAKRLSMRCEAAKVQDV